jgi:F-type H+-transporting ATPase subunit a
VAAASKLDPMHQFHIEGLSGALNGSPFTFTNSALWMFFVLAAIILFMWGGMKRELIPGRWQAAVEGFVEFVSGMTLTSIGPEGRKYTPWIFTIFTFILFANYLSLFPSGFVPGGHPFAVTAQFTVTGLMAVISFSIVLIVGFWRHKLHFLSLFVPHGTPKPMIPLIATIEFISFMVRPFSLALRLFVAMIAGHILFEVFGNFVVQGINSGTVTGYVIAAIAFIFVLGVNALELLVCAIQAYVFALLSSLYINDAVNLH